MLRIVKMLLLSTAIKFEGFLRVFQRKNPSIFQVILYSKQ